MDNPSRKPLPYNEEHFSSADQYVESLLNLVATNEMLRTLCGGVHILDFFTSDPELYIRVIPSAWREFFAENTVMGILDLLMRDDLSDSAPGARSSDAPSSLIDYIDTIRKHLLDRQPRMNQRERNRYKQSTRKLPRHVAVGMTTKKVHEVGIFACYIDELASEMSEHLGQPISHLIDFGSGQNYLGRALASNPYNRNIVAIESKASNSERARDLDVKARLAVKPRIMRNKKAFRAGLETPDIAVVDTLQTTIPSAEDSGTALEKNIALTENDIEGVGKIRYVEHRIENSDLSDVVNAEPNGSVGNIMVMSLHSCGNLVHHGLRSLPLNPSVRAVAMIGCCYNLVTERLGPATYKLPELRPTRSHPRLEKTGNAYDPHGFPMSQRLCEYNTIHSPSSQPGVRLNITARMMAVQAPQNWGEEDSNRFFTRHFYRALLQRIFFERGVVGPPLVECVGGVSPAGHGSGGTPIVIGSLKKSCYEDFVSYVRGALAKLMNDTQLGSIMREKMSSITDQEILSFEIRYAEKWKDLSIVWGLMAFSAGVVEAIIVVDRWLWLTEQEEIAQAWVEPVFDYKISPRNLVVVGIKKKDGQAQALHRHSNAHRNKHL